MQYQVSELSGALLDAAVAKAEGIQHDTSALPRAVFVHQGSDSRQYAPSKDWRDGGQIIQRERIAVYPPLCVGDWDEWTACVGGKVDSEKGATPLIAAMRAYVDSKFGETVELP